MSIRIRVETIVGARPRRAQRSAALGFATDCQGAAVGRDDAPDARKAEPEPAIRA
ncbi:MAG: hypothetical protein AB7G23_15245 [Vicinamibacterales bacterium]